MTEEKEKVCVGSLMKSESDHVNEISDNTATLTSLCLGMFLAEKCSNDRILCIEVISINYFALTTSLKYCPLLKV